MLGFADESDAAAYGLIGAARERRRSPLTAAAALAVVGACATVGVLLQRHGSDSTVASSASTFSMSLMQTTGSAASDDTCATKPFQQCAGMNFSASKADRDAHNFTEVAQQFACCPAGTACVAFGPV